MSSDPIAQCPAHEEYEEGCEACFEEACASGIHWLTTLAMPHTEARRMPNAGPGHAVFELFFEETRLFAFVYRNGTELPANALEVVQRLEDEAHSTARRAEQAWGWHASKAAAARRRVDIIQGWSIPPANEEKK